MYSYCHKTGNTVYCYIMPNGNRYCIEGFSCLGWPETRIYELINTAAEDNINLNLDSLEKFKELLKTKTNLSRPMLTLTVNGVLKATWGDPKDKHLNIRFTPTSETNSIFLYAPLTRIDETINLHLEQASSEVINVVMDLAHIIDVPIYDIPRPTPTGDEPNA